MCCRTRSLVGVAFLWMMLAQVGRAGESPGRNWPNWRGPSGQGYVDDSNVPLTWSEKENLVWKTELAGRGNSTPIIWGDRIFLTAASKTGHERYVICISKSDGKLLWQRTASKGIPPDRTHNWNGHASPSCTTDGQRVYAFFGTPGLFCYDFEGKLLWHHDFGVFTCTMGWGTAASPLVFEDLVIQNCDNDGAKGLPKGSDPKSAAPMALVALDKVKGTVCWQTPRHQGFGFSTPRLLTTPAGRLELVLNGPDGVWAYDPRSGNELWHSRRTGDKGTNKFGEPMPVSAGDLLITLSGRPGPAQAVRLDGAGDITKSRLWETRRKGRDVGSPIIWGDYFYVADRNAVLTCLDLKTGIALYSRRLAADASAMASPVALRGKLLFLLDTGETVVLEPGPKFKEVGRNALGEKRALDFAASPAVSAGNLFLRSQSHLYCVGVRGFQ
jgi:outer membrane protein assembly factor BamB